MDTTKYGEWRLWVSPGRKGFRCCLGNGKETIVSKIVYDTRDEAIAHLREFLHEAEDHGYYPTLDDLPDWAKLH